MALSVESRSRAFPQVFRKAVARFYRRA